MLTFFLLTWALRAEPPADGYATMVKMLNSMRTVVAREAGKGPPPPIDEQRVRLRQDLVPMLCGDLKRDVERWLDAVDAQLPDFREGHFRTLKPVLQRIKAQHMQGVFPGATGPAWLELADAKKLRNWADLAWDPLLGTLEQDITDAEELLVVLGFRLDAVTHEPDSSVAPSATPSSQSWRRERIVWKVQRPPDQEKVERALQAGIPLRKIYRKVWLETLLYPRGDGWIIERWRWLNPPTAWRPR